MRDLRVGHRYNALEAVAESAQAGAEDHAHLRLERRARADEGRGLVEARDQARARRHIIIPASVAERNAARFPASIARRPKRAMSLRRLGARPPMPPIWIPMLEKLAKPRSA